MKSDEDTRFIRLRPSVQASVFFVLASLLAWVIIATSILVMDNIGAGNFREQALRDQESYQQRLNYMSQERDIRAEEATKAQRRFDEALEQVSIMQTELLDADLKRRELIAALETTQTKMRRVLQDSNAAKQELSILKSDNPELVAQLNQSNSGANSDQLSFLTKTLNDTASERDRLEREAQAALDKVNEIEMELRLTEERNEQIFRQIEEAMTVSIEPLNKMFRAVGKNPDTIIDVIRKGYSGYGGPMTKLSSHGSDPTMEELRANAILNDLDEMNIYRIAVEKIPFANPLKSAYRYTSGYGRRWGRMHYGTDFAAPHGTPIYASADGVVVHAGWASGYGRLIKIRHEFGYETRFGHLSKIRVNIGQKVSRGERIGDMGNTGRSTGTHLHYEIRINGNAINPMKYLEAGHDVF
ncbi:MAG: M23 family peptidase [Rhodobacteraceae bacterium]|nr:M23 family peptidase [Paracoccaceae bacterium]